MKSVSKTLPLLGLLVAALTLAALPLALAQEEKPAVPAGEQKEQPNREEELLQLIKQMQQELQQLRREVQELRNQRPGDAPREAVRDGDARREGGERDGAPRDGDRPAAGAARRPGRTGRIFDAYDKDRDSKVSFEEWLQMREGVITGERRIQEQMRYNTADTTRDGGLTFEEFAYYLENRGRQPEGPIRGKFLAADQTQYTLFVSLEGRSGEGGVSTPDGEKTFDVARDAVIIIDQGKPGKLSDLREGNELQLWLSIDGAKVAAIHAQGPHFGHWRGKNPGDVAKAIDAEKRTITFAGNEDHPADFVFPVAADAQIVVDGRAATLDDLPAGARLLVTISVDGKTAVGITQVGER